MAGVLLQSCSEADLPQRSVQPDDCLRDMQLDQLQQALKRCDQVVARYPQDPAPRNERALLLSLNGQDQAACREIEAAHALARQARPGSVDPLLASELKMRRQSCLASR
jgi:hypothetical protein